MDRKLTVTHTEWSIMELLWDEPRTLMELVNTGQNCGLVQKHRHHHGAADDRTRVDRL